LDIDLRSLKILLNLLHANFVQCKEILDPNCIQIFLLHNPKFQYHWNYCSQLD